MEKEKELKCIFTNCNSSEEVTELSQTRLISIAGASEKREDDFSEVIEKLKTDGVVLASHRSRVSTHTSTSHIARFLKKKH